MDVGTYGAKALSALSEHFTAVETFRPKEAKFEVVKPLQKANLETLCSRVKAIKENCLSLFFSAKMHKPDVPFRAIISERHTWQLQV
ncbi:hypothetical protein HPB48_016473 [Haemaphysalis longicornis]|uniref:Uncharacterized protein n=1 Tax=Haemaphysalis longicornis TaxID=44386 RepID=A0A9J6FEJ0_HAELO|nr:hypothetical protein HPB48_016473 [Haemaphysalis longicornis]